MQHLLSPGTVLAVLFVLIAAQATRLLAPRRAPYVATLALAAIGLVAGELLALSGHLQGPSLGVLHPVPDAVLIAAIEVAGTLMTAPRTAEA